MFHKAQKDNNMGIHFAKQNRITSSNPLKVTYSLRLFQFLLILFGVIGPIYGFISGLKIEVLNHIVITTIVLSTIYYFVIYQFPSVLKYTLIASVMFYFIAVYEFIDEIKNGFWHIENYCIYYINTYYNMNIYPYMVEKYDKQLVVSIFISFVIVVFTSVVSCVILFNYFGGLYMLLSATLIIFPLAVGIIPGTLPLALYLIFAICMIGMGKFTTRNISSSIKKNQKKQWKLNVVLGNKFRYLIGLKVGIILSVILTILFLFIPMVFPAKNYEELNIKETKTKLQNKLMNFSIEDTTKQLTSNDFSNWSPFQSKKYGGLSGGELGKEGEVTFDNKPVLKVEMPITSNTIYLKGYVGSVYTGDKWDSLNKNDEAIYSKLLKKLQRGNFNPGNQNSYFLSLLNVIDNNLYKDFNFSRSNMKVNNVRSNKKYSYAPYNTIFNDKSMNVLDPLYVYPYKANELENFEYYTNYTDIFNFNESNEFEKCLNYYTTYGREKNVNEQNMLDLLIQYRENELEYRDFVYSTYTKLSDKVPDSLIREFGDYKYNPYGNNGEGSNLKALLEMVANYLETNTSYSLKPGPLPEGKDYIEYFLYENKVGYCAHYATAATVMLRIMGIPARYAEGYIVKESNILKGKEIGKFNVEIRGEDNKEVPIKEVDVLDANAHAWAEVYIDGFGWIPVEFTSGYNQSASGALNPAVVNQLQPTNIPNTSNPVNNGQDDISNITPTPTLAPTKAPTKAPSANGTVGNESNGNGIKGENGDTSSTDTNSSDESLGNKKLNLIYLGKVFMIIIKVLAIIMLFILIIVSRWFYISYNKKMKVNNSNLDKVVIYRYKELLRILSYCGVELNNQLTYQLATKEIEEKCQLLNKGELENFVAISLKAKFSPYKINKEEANQIELLYKECIDSLYNNKSYVERLYLKYFKVFL